MASVNTAPIGKLVVSQLVKKFFALLLNPKFRRPVHSSPRPVFVLSQSNPINEPPI
jgi:hypothetical protein